MIYNKNTTEYRVKFFKDLKAGQSPVLEYLEGLSKKEQAKILKYIDFLKANKGYLDQPYSKHIKRKIRELRIDFAKNRHRIFYCLLPGKIIILLHAFLKKAAKTPGLEIIKAENNYQTVLNNLKIYE